MQRDLEEQQREKLEAKNRARDEYKEKMKKATEIGVIDDSGPPKKGGGGGRRKGKRDDGEINTSDEDEGAPGGEGAEGASKAGRLFFGIEYLSAAKREKPREHF